MARRTRKKIQSRKPFWERMLERFVSIFKRFLIPALGIWLVAWLWMGGVFASAKQVAWDGFVDWTAAQGLVVEDVVIEGRHRMPLDAIKNAMDVKPNDPLLRVDVDKIRQTIEQQNWVHHVTVGRAYNGIVTIDIVERIPFVVWIRPGRETAVVDTVGHVIEGANPKDFKALLHVRGVDAPKYTVDLMQMILAEPLVADYIKQAEWIGDRRWDLITSNQTRIHLPESDVGYALSRLAKIHDEKKILDRGVLSIDLRGADRIIVENKRGQSRDVLSMPKNEKQI